MQTYDQEGSLGAALGPSSLRLALDHHGVPLVTFGGRHLADFEQDQLFLMACLLAATKVRREDGGAVHVTALDRTLNHENLRRLKSAFGAEGARVIQSRKRGKGLVFLSLPSADIRIEDHIRTFVPVLLQRSWNYQKCHRDLTLRTLESACHQRDMLFKILHLMQWDWDCSEDLRRFGVQLSVPTL